MNKFRKTFYGSLFGCSMLASMVTGVYAEDLTIHFTGQDQGFTLDSGETIKDPDLFTSFKNVMPGDVLTQTITVTNKNTDTDYITLYLEIDEHDDEKNPLSNHVDNNEESVEKMKEFLSELTLRLRNGNNLIFEGAPHYGGASIKLGDFAPEESAVITAELVIPAELGNDFANRFGEVDWRFKAEAKDHVNPGPGDKDPIKPGGNKNPAHTSTDNNIIFWGVALITAGFILFGLVKDRKKSNKEM